MADTRKFPYSDYDVVVVERDDILKTIDDNIIDKEIAIELINSLEVRAETYLREKRRVGIPYLGNIGIPEGLSDEIKDRKKDALHYAYETMTKKQYIAFVKDIAYDDKARIKYKGFFNQILAMAVRKNKQKWTNLCRTKGENYASCKMVFGYRVLPMKEDYEYIIENEDDVELEELLNNEN